MSINAPNHVAGGFSPPALIPTLDVDVDVGKRHEFPPLVVWFSMIACQWVRRSTLVISCLPMMKIFHSREA